MLMKEEEIKDHLMSSDPEFRRLVEEHKHYEGQLEALLNRHHMSESDHLEEVRLKKLKLNAKDQIELRLSRYRAQHVA